jgi:FtsP/CotA-like multicopper oxidase with cupredoxin domain
VTKCCVRLKNLNRVNFVYFLLHTVKPVLTRVVIGAVIAVMLAAAVVIATTVSSDDNEGVLLSPMRNDIKKLSLDPDKFLREFNYGKVSTLPDGTTLREFTIIAEDIEIEVAPGIFFNAWSYNGTVPGPTIRVTEGDRVKITFINHGQHSHTIHLHGIHPAEMDGVFEIVGSGGRIVYEFTAEPFGLFLYHCHVPPVAEHINRGLYGAFIVDPKTPRPPADEMVMIMNGFDTDFDEENNFYAVNGPAFYFMKNPIKIKTDQLIRVYLINILEFDQINSLHIHGNMYKLYRTGTSLTNYEITDMVTMSQGERAVLEFTYKYPGRYMFHAHQNEFADKGWMGVFDVVEDLDADGNGYQNSSKGHM